eukprot:gene8337-877_t
MALEINLVVRGTVQKVMFRQTVVRAAQRIGLKAGASNMRYDRSLVKLTLIGDEDKVHELVTALSSGKKLNSWGAVVKSLEEDSDPIPYDQHQVTTENVDQRNWNPNVEMYL